MEVNTALAKSLERAEKGARRHIRTLHRSGHETDDWAYMATLGYAGLGALARERGRATELVHEMLRATSRRLTEKNWGGI